MTFTFENSIYPEPEEKQLTVMALGFAMAAHAGQKYGDNDYYLHCSWVAELFGDYPAVYAATAFLHDVLEDTEITEEYLRGRFGDTVTDAVVILTRKPGHKYFDYIQSIIDADNHIATMVKVADLSINFHNSRMDPERAGQAKRYAKALKMFGTDTSMYGEY